VVNYPQLRFCDIGLRICDTSAEVASVTWNEVDLARALWALQQCVLRRGGNTCYRWHRGPFATLQARPGGHRDLGFAA
jgi:hypothetical protein